MAHSRTPNSNTVSSTMRLLHETRIPAPKITRGFQKPQTQRNLSRRTSGLDFKSKSNPAPPAKLSKLATPHTLNEVLGMTEATSPIMPHEAIRSSVIVRGFAESHAPSESSTQAMTGFFSFPPYTKNSKPLSPMSQEPSTTKIFYTKTKKRLWSVVTTIGAGAKAVTDFYANGEHKWETEYPSYEDVKESNLSDMTPFEAIDSLDKENMQKIELARGCRRHKSLGQRLREYWKPTPADTTIREMETAHHERSSDSFTWLCSENKERITIGEIKNPDIPRIPPKCPERIQQRRRRHRPKSPMGDSQQFRMTSAERRHMQPSQCLRDQQFNSIQQPESRNLPPLAENETGSQDAISPKNDEPHEQETHGDAAKERQAQPGKQEEPVDIRTAHHHQPSLPASTPWSHLNTINEDSVESQNRRCQGHEDEEEEEEEAYFPFLGCTSFVNSSSAVPFRASASSFSFSGRCETEYDADADVDADDDADDVEGELDCSGFEAYAGGEVCFRHRGCVREGMRMGMGC